MKYKYTIIALITIIIFISYSLFTTEKKLKQDSNNYSIVPSEKLKKDNVAVIPTHKSTKPDTLKATKKTPITTKNKEKPTIVSPTPQIKPAKIQKPSISSSFESEQDDNDWRFIAENKLNYILSENNILALSLTNEIRCKSSLCRLKTTSETREKAIQLLRNFLSISKKNGFEPDVDQIGGDDNDIIVFIPKGDWTKS